jgi:hypothetical protein
MSEISRGEKPEEIQSPPEQPEQALENQESKEPMVNGVLRDFQKFVEGHTADWDFDDISEIDFLSRMFEKPSFDMWDIYEDFYQSNIDNRKYQDNPETRKAMEEYDENIAVLLEDWTPDPNVKIRPDSRKKWLLGNINGGVDSKAHMGRFYLNLKPDGAVSFYMTALEELQEAGVHVGAKIVMQGRVKCFNQRDKMVVYFDSEEEQQVLEAIQNLYEFDAGDTFDDTGIPAFSAEVKDRDGNIMKGIGFGEDPGGDGEESFGTIRSQILFEICSEVKKMKKKNPEMGIPFEKYHELFLKYCKKRNYRVDPENPAFNLTRKKHKPFPIIRGMAKEN